MNIPTEVVPKIVNIQHPIGVPFITNNAKQAFHKRMIENNTPIVTEKIESLPLHNDGDVTKVTQTGYPLAKTNPPLRSPTAVYDQYAPLVDLSGNKRFLPTNYAQLTTPTSAVSYGPNVKMPVQQVYNINLPGPTGRHVEMNKIYEDILPGKDTKLYFYTLGERLQIHDYLRQILIKISDGEEIGIDNTHSNSLLSYIKLMDLNPNYYSPLFNNPYAGLPYGLLIYRSCYPIRFQSYGKTIGCAKDTISLTLRLYSLSVAAYCSYQFKQPIYKKYDVWRELIYYQYVKEHILKRRQSPHFVLLYAYFISPNNQIDYFSLKRKSLTSSQLLSQEYQNFQKIFNGTYSLTVPLTIKVKSRLPDEIDTRLTSYSGNTLILVTECPTQNIYQWASRIYENEGLIHRMISDGTHDEFIWYGILFQIVSALYVMQINCIYINEMTLADNVYIKDLPNVNQSRGHWKYVIDNIEYYLPNNGYVVLIDSNYKEIAVNKIITDECKRDYKIYINYLYNKTDSATKIKNNVFQNYRRLINSNAFTKEHTTNNVMKPPPSIMKLLDAMTMDNETDLAVIITKYFRSLMNNRIGTYLRKDTEVPHIRQTIELPLRGKLAIEVIEDQLYRWCLVLNVQSGGMVEILTKDHPKDSLFVTKTVRPETLKTYSSVETIDQDYHGKINLSNDELLETYVISN